MKRLRIGIVGKAWGIWNIRWTVIACNVVASELHYAQWAVEKFNGLVVNVGSVKGVVFVELT
jgi:hypothetical protein